MRYFFGGYMQGNQRISVIDRKSVEIDNVLSVRAFDEDGVLLETPLGKISVEGSELKIENFEKASAKILISGNIIGVFYLEKSQKKKGRGLFG